MSDYFSRFPVLAGYKIDGRTQDAIDITRRTAIAQSAKQDPKVYIEYVIQEGETPEILADRMYDSVILFWVILMFNDIHDLENEWPLDAYCFDRYVTSKYEDPYAIHHYYSAATGAYVDQDHVEYDRIPVTNYEYEVELNDQKRYINLPVPNAVDSIIQQHNTLIRQ